VRIIQVLATAELVSKVLVVFVASGWFLGAHARLAGLLVDSESARRSRREAGCAAVTFKVPLCKQLHEAVFAMTGDGTGVAGAGCGVRRIGIRRRRIAGEAGKERLSERAERSGARVKGLKEVF
jgi:hypothetical protein